MIEIISNHIEGFVRCCSNQKVIDTKTKKKNRRFHICWIKSHMSQSLKIKIVANIECGIEWNQIAMFWQFLI